MSNAFRGIGSMNDSLERQTSDRLGVTQTLFDSKDKANEMLKTLGEAKSAISGKGLVDKVTGNIKKAVNKKAKEVVQNVKDRVGKAADDALERGKKGVSDALQKQATKLGKRGVTEDSGLQQVANRIFPKMDAPIEGEAEETSALRTGQAASRGEQIANDMAAARESGDVGLTGGEDALRVGQAAGKAGVPGPPSTSAPGFKDATSSEEEMKAGSQEGKAATQAAEKDAAAAAEKDAAGAAEKDAAGAAERQVVRGVEKKVVKGVVKGAVKGAKVDEDLGGPEDVVGDAIGLVVGAATTIYSAFKKPHLAIANNPISEASQSFQVGM